MLFVCFLQQLLTSGGVHLLSSPGWRGFVICRVHHRRLGRRRPPHAHGTGEALAPLVDGHRAAPWGRAPESAAGHQGATSGGEGGRRRRRGPLRLVPSWDACLPLSFSPPTFFCLAAAAPPCSCCEEMMAAPLFAVALAVVVGRHHRGFSHCFFLPLLCRYTRRSQCLSPSSTSQVLPLVRPLPVTPPFAVCFCSLLLCFCCRRRLVALCGGGGGVGCAALLSCLVGRS